MERLPKRVHEWLNRKFESLGADPATIDEMFKEHLSNESIDEKIGLLAAKPEKGLYQSVQELLFSEKGDADFEKIDVVEGLDEMLSLCAGNVQRISALISIRGSLEYYYANSHILEIGIAKDDAAIAAAELKRQRKADRRRKQMKVAS
jgi:hypothetical protein